MSVEEQSYVSHQAIRDYLSQLKRLSNMRHYHRGIRHQMRGLIEGVAVHLNYIDDLDFSKNGEDYQEFERFPLPFDSSTGADKRGLL